MNLPFDQFVDDFISKLGLKKASKGEYHGPCPNCGGEDRFWINKYNGELNHHCRKECSLAARTNALKDLGLIPPYTNPSASKNTNRTELRSHIYEEKNSTPVRKAIKYSDGSWTQQRYEDGKWLYGVKDTPNVLYGLPRILEDYTDKIVFVFEGEKDCELAWEYGLLATTNVGGAGNWKDELNKPLEGRTVCLVPDNDNAGSNHVTRVSKSLTEGGIQNFILWNYREKLSEKGDFSDWMVANNNNVDMFLGLVQKEQEKPSVPPKPKHSDSSTKRLFTKLSEIDRTPPIPIIEDMIFAKSFVGITGASYAGKSFVALDMFLPVAVGRNYYDKQTAQGNVGLIIGEGRDGIIERCEAWCASKGVEEKDVNIYITKQAINVRDQASIDAAVNELKEVGQFQVIIIDTLSRNFGGGNENAPMDMGEFIMACDKLIHDLDCCVVTVHHTGKDASAGARGHSSYFAALTTEIKVEAKGAYDIVVKNTKQKDFREFEPLQFLKVETKNSVTLEPVGFFKGNQRSKVTGNEKLALDTFAESYRDKPVTNLDDQACRLHLDEWREIFNRRHTGDNKKSKNTAFSRARTSLVTKGILKVEDDYYSYGDEATDGDKW